MYLSSGPKDVQELQPKFGRKILDQKRPDKEMISNYCNRKINDMKYNRRNNSRDMRHGRMLNPIFHFDLKTPTRLQESGKSVYQQN